MQLLPYRYYVFVFFFNDTATTEIYTLSLHDALPNCSAGLERSAESRTPWQRWPTPTVRSDRKSTRLNSSHRCISYAVFCLKKKKTKQHGILRQKKTT